VTSFFRSFAHTARRLRRAPAFSVAAALTLMLGIGATTAVFSVVNAVVLRPLPYPRPDRLVDLSHTLAVSGVLRVDQSDATFLHYRQANRVFSGVAAYRVTAINVGALGGSNSENASAERVAVGRVTATTFAVLGASPLRGRVLTETDDQPSSPRVVVIGQRLWERKYGSDPAIVGRALEIDGMSHEVVGVMPADFGLPAARTDLWVPLRLDRTNTASAAFDYRGVARLRDGVSIATAAGDLQRLLPQVPDVFPGRLTAGAIEQTRMQAVVRPLRDVVVGDVGRVLWVVLGAVACLLLVACANVMNLFLVRAEQRQHELAVRRALGASGAALVRDQMAEGVLLTCVGGTLGLLVGLAGVRVLRSLEGAIDVPRLAEVNVDAAVLLAAVAATVFALLLVTVIPALRAASASVTTVLGDSGRSVTTGRGRHRARHALIAVQMALAVVLLVGAGLMARSFARLRAVPTGFDASSAFAFRVALPRASYAGPTDPARFIARALDEIAAVGGVQVAAAVTKLPLVDEARRDTALFVEDKPLTPGTLPNVHQVAFASPGYFRAMGVPLLEGRDFARPDPAAARPEAIVSRALADRYWRGEPVVGKRVRTDPRGQWLTIVGVAADVRGTALDEPPDEVIYLPLVVSLGTSQAAGSAPLWSPREIAFVARSEGNAASVGAAVQRTVRALDPSIPTYGARAMTDVVAQAASRTTFTLLLLGIASVVTLVLGAVGIYGVVSYVVSLRTREVAVRLALGAQPAQVRRMVSRQAMTVAALGIAIGLVGAVGITRVLGALLYAVSPTDPASLAAAAVLLAAVAAMASWIPARRAARLDPALALRGD
jgi:putative ABC transport system permease protein